MSFRNETVKAIPKRCCVAVFVGAFSFLVSAWLYGQVEDKSKAPKQKPPARLDWDEIRSSPLGFQNYSAKTAPYSMRLLDKELGAELARKAFDSKQTVFSSKGLEIRRIFDPKKTGLGADIISISKKSNFGHINRLQRVLQAYLESSFNFSEKDARIASRFILYYNARNRAKIEHIKKRYSQKVLASLNPEKVGIARSYRNWSGKTQLLLPLRKNILTPQGRDLNLKEIAKDKGKGAVPIPEKEQKEFRKTEQRRNTIELEKLDQKAKELKESQAKNKKQKAKLGQEQKKLSQKAKALDSLLKKMKKDPQKNAKAIEEAEKKKREIARKQRLEQKKSKILEQKQKGNIQKQKEVKQQKKEAQAQAKELAKASRSFVPKSLKNKKDSAKKQKELEKLKAENERLKASIEKNLVQDKLLFMRVLRYTKKGHYQNELWYLDANQDDALFHSPFRKICSRDFAVIPNKGVVVTGYKGSVDSKTDHHLFLLDLDKLNKLYESKIFVHWRTPLIFRKNKLYVFSQKKEKYYLARLNENLRPEVESKASINPYSEITFYKNKIFLTGQDKEGSKTTIHIFRLKDLSTVKIIKPKPSSY